MKDQELMTDLLLSEKKMSDNYSIWASECTNVQLRDTFLSILTKGHKTQTDLYATAQQKGWYQKAESAQPDKVSQAYQQFSSQAPTVQ